MRAGAFFLSCTLGVRGLVSQDGPRPGGAQRAKSGAGPPGGAEAPEDRCSGPEASARLWSLTRAFQENRSKWHLLEEDGCLGQDELEEIANDPEDAAEYLGDERPHSLISPGLCMRFKRPNVFYIGVGHGGSTTLSRHLERHPQISFGRMKEHDFWKAGRRPSCTFRQYLREFPVPCRTKAVIDFPVRLYRQALSMCEEACEWGPWAQRGQPSTPLGEAYVAKFRELMGGNVKLIMMIRNPYDKLNSVNANATEILNNLTTGAEVLPKTLCKWEGSRYAEALELWMRYFPRENFLFLQSEEFFNDPQNVLDKIFRFLRLMPRPYLDRELEYSSGRRRSKSKARITEKQRHDFYSHPMIRADREKLEKMTGLTFDWH